MLEFSEEEEMVIGLEVEADFLEEVEADMEVLEVELDILEA